MTRGTIAFLDKDEFGRWRLFASEEFNGTMGPEGHMGLATRLRLMEKFFRLDDCLEKKKVLDEIVKQTTIDFGYSEKEELDDLEFLEVFKKKLNVESPMSLNECRLSNKRIDYDNDNYWKCFNGSDYAYVFNLDESNVFEMIEEKTNNRIELLPKGKEAYIFGYSRQLEYVYSQNGLEKIKK